MSHREGDENECRARDMSRYGVTEHPFSMNREEEVKFLQERESLREKRVSDENTKAGFSVRNVWI